MKVTLETIIAIVGAIGVIGGIISWWLSRILEDRKDSIQQAMELKFLREELAEIKREDIAEMKKDIEEIQKWYNNGRNN